MIISINCNCCSLNIETDVLISKEPEMAQTPFRVFDVCRAWHVTRCESPLRGLIAANRCPRARLSVARRNLKKAGGKVPGEEHEPYEAQEGG